MLRRVTRSSNGRIGPFSGAILPACAALLVPLLAATALELPAAAIDRIASPLLGRSDQFVSLLRPAAVQSASSAHGVLGMSPWGSSPERDAWSSHHGSQPDSSSAELVRAGAGGACQSS